MAMRLYSGFMRCFVFWSLTIDILHYFRWLQTLSAPTVSLTSIGGPIFGQMPIKGMIREFHDMKACRGNISRRSLDPKMSQLQRVRSHSAALDNRVYKLDTLRIPQQSCWGNMPPELLRDIIRRIEESESTWPSRKDVVACASVCSSWRDITKDLVKTPEQSGKLTFPISLKQPGPRDAAMQCFIKRDRNTLTYYLYLGLTPTLVENGKFLLAARKFRRATSTDYIISLDADDMSRGGDTLVGKLRSNFLGTKFTIYDSQPLHRATMALFNHSGKGFGPKQISLQVPAGAFDVAHIVYERNMLGTRGPRRMQCTLHSIPVSAVEEGGSLATSTDNSGPLDSSISSVSLLRSRATVADDSSTTESGRLSERPGKDAPLMLKNKSPRWHEQLQCWCLNFRGRVTVASVKNFQLVAAVEPSQQGGQVDQDKVLLQFGKIGKDMFTMDYRYPLSAFQAFAICLSSFDTKLACE